MATGGDGGRSRQKSRLYARPIPGPRPSGRLTPSKIAPGDFVPAATEAMSDKFAGANLADRRSARRVPARDGPAQNWSQASFPIIKTFAAPRSHWVRRQVAAARGRVARGRGPPR